MTHKCRQRGEGGPPRYSRRAVLTGMVAAGVAPGVMARAWASGADPPPGAIPAKALHPLNREGHTSTDTPFGTVVAGGYRFGALASVQIFDGQKWRDAPAMHAARYLHAALGYNGGVLVMGGISCTGDLLASAEFFDGLRWTRVHPMRTPRAQLAAVLYNGAPVAIGGRYLAPLSTVEAYDGSAWQPMPRLARARFGHTAAVQGGIIVIEGGWSSGGPMRSAESFNGAAWVRGILKST